MLQSFLVEPWEKMIRRKAEESQVKTFYDYPPRDWAGFFDKVITILERLGTKYIQFEESKAKGVSHIPSSS